MAQHPLQQLISTQQLDQIFLTSLSPKEYQYCLDHAQLIDPDLGKLWSIEDIIPGLYIILAGKVRLLDQDDEPIESLGVGQYFGEYTFFAGEALATYTARAGVNVQLWFLPLTALKKL